MLSGNVAPLTGRLDGIAHTGLDSFEPRMFPGVVSRRRKSTVSDVSNTAIAAAAAAAAVAAGPAEGSVIEEPGESDVE